MTEEKIDPELDKLLQDIENAEDSEPEQEMATEDTTTEVVHDKDGQPLEEEESIVELEKALASAGADIDDDDDDDDDDDFGSFEDKPITTKAEVIAPPTDKEKLEQSIVGLVSQHVDSVGMMVEEAECDRKKIDDILGVLMPRIENGDYRGQDIMAVTSLIQSKIDVSKNRASLMDSIAKLFASVKGNDAIGINGKAADEDFSDDDLDNLLS